MNTILYGFLSTAVAVYGICARIQNLAGIPVHGIDSGLIPWALGNGGYSMYVTIARQVILPAGFAFLLSGTGNLNMV